eukprot:NODE_16_length_49026_cov_1.035992.p21 type:complete len:151 gc:universal NODE_16_length_49026_cov_1.035992:38967-39419(+)
MNSPDDDDHMIIDELFDFIDDQHEQLCKLQGPIEKNVFFKAIMKIVNLLLDKPRREIPDIYIINDKNMNVVEIHRDTLLIICNFQLHMNPKHEFINSEEIFMTCPISTLILLSELIVNSHINRFKLRIQNVMRMPSYSSKYFPNCLDIFE